MNTETENVLTQAQIEHLASLYFINKIDKSLKIVSKVGVLPKSEYAENHVLLLLDIFYKDQKVDDMSFNLESYEYEEIIELAQNIQSNEYILQAVDNLLAGDIE